MEEKLGKNRREAERLKMSERDLPERETSMTRE